MGHKTKRGKFLYLPIEIKARELDSKLLLAYYAVQENYRVILGEHQILEKALPHFPEGIFFSKGYPYRIRKKVLSEAQEAGHVVVELDEEGLIFYDQSLYLSDRMNKDGLDIVEQEYCWGDFQQEVVQSAYPHYKDKCFKVGNLRFDLLRGKFRNIYSDRVEDLKGKYGDFILINTRFTKFNHFKGKRAVTTGSDSAYIKVLYEHFIELIPDICRMYPNLNVIVRPHPGENLNSYREAFSDYGNVYVIHEGNVLHWILASKLVIHNGCTTGIEASLLRKPVISYMPVQSEKYDVNLPNDVSFKASTVQDMFQIIDSTFSEKGRRMLEGELRKKHETSLFKYYKYEEYGNYAYQTILNLLNQLDIRKGQRQLNMDNIKWNSKRKRKNKRRRRRHRNKVKYRFPDLTKEEIQVFFEKIDKIEGLMDQRNVLIRNITDNLFELYVDRNYS